MSGKACLVDTSCIPHLGRYAHTVFTFALQWLVKLMLYNLWDLLIAMADIIAHHSFVCILASVSCTFPYLITFSFPEYLNNLSRSCSFLINLTSQASLKKTPCIQLTSAATASAQGITKQAVVGQARKEKTLWCLRDASKIMMDLEKGLTKYSNTITRWLLSRENRKLQIQNKQTKIFFTEYVTLPDVDHKILYTSQKRSCISS